MSSTPSPALDQLCINTLRFLSVDAVEKANSGHPGLPLDAAPMAYVLWTRFLKHNPTNPNWMNRDRFVLSAGHGSALLYSLLHVTGYGLSLEELKHFRQWDSLTPGHPEHGKVPGVDITTGPLGQGFANGVGMAMIEAHLAACYNRKGFELIDHYTYGIVSDGDMMEGVASEAASLAGHLQLGKLIYLYDFNQITLSGATDITFTENCEERFNAYGWHTQQVEDGNDVEEIEHAIKQAQNERNRPSLIIVHTHIGYGSPKQDTFQVHGSPLGEKDAKLTKQKLNWPSQEPLYVPEECGRYFLKAKDQGAQLETEWKQLLVNYEKSFPELAKQFNQVIQNQLAPQWEQNIPKFPPDAKGMATREASGKVMNAMAANLPRLLGGSADLNPSTDTALKGLGDFGPPQTLTDVQGSVGGGWSYAGRNISYGVREHAMGAISNGMAAHGGAMPFCATFFNFSDYLRPTMRLAAMMELQVIYVFTHDSIGLGEDGPTHQPIEQLMSLRAIPNLTVIRPCDANETAVAWQTAVMNPHSPTALILTRQKLPTLDRKTYASADGLKKGAYILSEAEGKAPQLILIATGSEVYLALEAQSRLQNQHHIPTRVVSMPSWELFEKQAQSYKNEVFPIQLKKRLAVEAGATLGWYKYIGENGAVIGIDHFGASAPGDIILKKFGFSVEHICEQALQLLK